MIDLINPERFAGVLRVKIKENNEILKAFGAKPLKFNKVHDAYRQAGDRPDDQHRIALWRAVDAD
jgi:hypothetical protein